MSAVEAPDAELAVIGALIQRPDLAEPVLARLKTADFVRHENPATVLWGMLRTQKTVDPQTFLAELSERQTLPREQCGPYVVRAVEAAYQPLSVGAYADLVIRAAQRRRLVGISAQLQLGVEGGADIEDLADETIKAIERIVHAHHLDDAPSMSLTELLDTPMGYDWVIPGLLERTDRFVLCAGEGAGKSTFLRQVALCAACGLHPFTLEPNEPMRVLMVDCENSRKQSARKFRSIVAVLRDMGWDPGDRLVYQSRPEGLNLSEATDTAWLVNRVMVDRPQLLTIGPAYRLCPTVSDDDVVTRVLEALDTVRLRAQCALILEAHPAQGQQWSKERDLRPKGSQLWRAWPESIRALRRDEDDTQLAGLEFAGRGDRDPRSWPRSMREGYDDELPWVALTPADADVMRERGKQRKVSAA